MRNGNWIVLAVLGVLLLSLTATADEEAHFEYPYYVVGAHDPDGNGLYGMNASGSWYPFVTVDPNIWLVGPPLSDVSAVTLPTDHWVELQFRGPIVDGPGYDIEILERGRVSEQALVFFTDGHDKEYLYTLIEAWDTGTNLSSYLQLDIAGLNLPFEPRAIRIIGLDTGGDCWGFDLQSVTARICTQCNDYPACNPIPVNGERRVALDTPLSWWPGDSAIKHIVYFGVCPNDVGPDATPVSSPTQGQDANSFDPGPLELDTTYYWRVDEVNSTSPDAPHTGNIWTFTTSDCILIEDFEVYSFNLSGGQPKLYPSWHPALYGANIDISADEEHVHSGAKSMLLNYDILEPYTSEIQRVFEEPQDWSEFGIKTLELFFRGDPNNGTGVAMYLSLNDGQATAKIPYNGDPNDLASEQWQRWIVNIENVPNVDANNIEYFGIGFTDSDPTSYANDDGTLYFDDIRLDSTVCLAELQSHGDFTGDCIVDHRDVEQLADSWLDRGYNVYQVEQPNEPALWYKFEGNVNDSGPKAYDGQILGFPIYMPGMYGLAMKFDGIDDAVSIVQARYLFEAINDGITIAFWQQGDNTGHDRDTLCCSDFAYGIKNPTVAVNFGCWKQPGRYFWQCGSQWSFDNQIAGGHKYISEWTERWNHWAFTKDSVKGEMRIYLNGALLDSRADSINIVGEVESFTIGSGWYGGYDGLIDDFRIYDYALSQKEIAYVATNGTGVFNLPLLSPLDLTQDDAIDFMDFAVLAENWLENQLWP